ncbi:MAG: hypothetical protein ACUVV3_01250 [Dehalococcoidia bacterium]
MRTLALAMATMLAVVGLVACGGDEEEEGPPAPARTPAAAETVTATPATAETATPVATLTPSGEGVTPGSLANLDSYRYTMKMEVKGLGTFLPESLGGLTGEEPTSMPETVEMVVSGAYVAPDKAEANMRISGLDVAVVMTIIGDQQWIRMGDMVMGPMEFEGDLSDMSLAYAMWGDFSEEAGQLTCASEKRETVNSVPSRYCGIDQATFEQLASLFGGTEEMGNIDDLNLEMWLAEDGGWPVRVVAHIAGTDEDGQEFEADLEMNITDVNKSIDIKTPS